MGLQPTGSKHNQVNTIPNSNNFKSMVKESVTSNIHGKAVSQSLKGTGSNHRPSLKVSDQFPIPAAETYTFRFLALSSLKLLGYFPRHRPKTLDLALKSLQQPILFPREPRLKLSERM